MNNQETAHTSNIKITHAITMVVVVVVVGVVVVELVVAVVMVLVGFSCYKETKPTTPVRGCRSFGCGQREWAPAPRRSRCRKTAAGHTVWTVIIFSGRNLSQKPINRPKESPARYAVFLS